MQRGFSLMLLLFFVAILAIVGAGSFFFFNKQQSSVINSFDDCAKKYPVIESYPAQCNTPDGRHFVQQLSEENSKMVPSEASSSAIIHDSENWKVYINRQYNYTLQYPSEYKITELGYPVGIENSSEIVINSLADQSLGFNIYVIKKEHTVFKNLTLEQIARENFNASQTNPHESKLLEPLNEMSLGGEKALSYTVQSNGYSGRWDGVMFQQRSNFRVIQAENRGNVYRIYFNIEDPVQEEILQTFTFL